MRYRARALVVCALAVGLAAAGCSKNSGTGNQPNPGDIKAVPIEIDTQGKAPTAAPEIPAVPSSVTVRWLERGVGAARE